MIEESLSSGTTHKSIISYLLLPGKHVERNIPSLPAHYSEKNPDVEFKITEPVGTHPLILNILEEKIKAL